VSTRPSLPGRLVIGLIRLYQRLLSPPLGRRCRFHPTCSVYAIEAIARKGLVIGLLKACWRIARCNPLNPGGYDPVEKGAAQEPTEAGGEDKEEV